MIRRIPSAPFGRCLALLALWALLVQAALLPQAGAMPHPADPLRGMATLCHAAGTTAPDAPPPDPGGDACVLCPFCLSLAGAPGLIGAAPAVPLSRSGDLGRVLAVPPVRAPPVRLVPAAYPRGPPVLA